MNFSEFEVYVISREIEKVEVSENTYLITVKKDSTFCIDKRICNLELRKGDIIKLYVHLGYILGIENAGKMLFFNPQSRIVWKWHIETDKYLLKEDETITYVEENKELFYIKTDQKSLLTLNKKYQITPSVGDRLTLYCIHCSVYGLLLNGMLLYFHTESDRKREWQQNVEKDEQEDILEFKRNEQKRDKQYNSLPTEFQSLISQYRLANPDSINWEDRFLFCCVEAVKIADANKIRSNVITFKELSLQEQYTIIPDLSVEHSGGTFSQSIGLAYYYLDGTLLTTKDFTIPQKKRFQWFKDRIPTLSKFKIRLIDTTI